MASPRLRQDLQHIIDSLQVSGEIPSARLDILKESLFKKFLGTEKDEHAKHVQALERFSATNERIRLFNDAFSSSSLTVAMASELAYVFQCEVQFSLDAMAEVGKCGPGASVGHKGDVDFFTKMFNSTLTHTSDALIRHYRYVLSSRWNSAESVRSKLHSTVRVDGSKITTVPKDEKKRRTICVEPILNMFYQLGAKSVLEGVLRRQHQIDVGNQQDFNREMAKQASVSGAYATIDLSDASDSISTSLIREILPRDVFNALDCVRSKRARVGSEWVDLHMFSTMGNGFTFVLMTLVLSTLIRSVYRQHGIHPKANSNYAVFGDDLIVRTDMYPHILQALDDLGFIPNQDKSFSTGFFRESCGADYIRGYNVRGVYCKGLNNEADLYSLFNRLVRWSSASGINIDALLVRLVRGLEGSLLLVPPDCSDNAGIKVPSALLHKVKGWQRYRYLSPIPRRYGTNRRVKVNEDGAITAFIGGYLGSTVTLRSESVSYKVMKNGYTPAWDRRVVWDELMLSSSTVPCWSSHDDQEVRDMLFRVLIRALMPSLEAA